MKTWNFFFLFLLISCQKQASGNEVTNANIRDKKGIVISKEYFLKTDTISILENGETSKTNFILVQLLEQKIDKDSLVTAKYQLDFYSNNTKTASSKIAIENGDKGSEWNAFYGLTSENYSESPFIQLGFGYPACGYSHSNFLFYLKGNSAAIVHQWQSVTDSGWGNWIEFVNPCAKANPESFYCKTVSFEPTNDGTEDFGILIYSDSIVFNRKYLQWTKKILSPKNKPYFEKKIAFDEFYKQN